MSTARTTIDFDRNGKQIGFVDIPHSPHEDAWGATRIPLAINKPAVLAGRRTSPVDGLNLNRTFPGDEAGTITQQISAYVSNVVMPLGDAYLDLHSGGSSLNILPSASIEPAS